MWTAAPTTGAPRVPRRSETRIEKILSPAAEKKRLERNLPASRCEYIVISRPWIPALNKHGCKLPFSPGMFAHRRSILSTSENIHGGNVWDKSGTKLMRLQHSRASHTLASEHDLFLGLCVFFFFNTFPCCLHRCRAQTFELTLMLTEGGTEGNVEGREGRRGGGQDGGFSRTSRGSPESAPLEYLITQLS